MYTMDPERPPSRPVVISPSSANNLFASWVRENNFSAMPDGAGLMWTVEVDVSQTPDPEDLHKATWALAMHAHCEPDAEDFIRTGTLAADSESDQRLADLLEDVRIPLRLRPIRSEASSEEGLRVFLADAMPKLRTHLAAQTFHDLKRQRIGAVIRERSLFGDK